MTSRLLNTIVLLGLVASIACSTSTIQALEEIKSKEFANDFVGQQIVDTILLQSQAGGSADVVIRLLNGLILNLGAQQKKHNQEHTVNNLFWRAELKAYRVIVKKLRHHIARLQNRLIRVSRRIRQNVQNTKANVAQQRLVRQKKAELKAARNIDRQAYLRRHARQVELLKAVNYIIAQLQLALKSHSFVQLEQIKEQLQKLTKENPLEALVQLTMTFKPSSVNYAINKLGQVRVGLEASIRDDSAHEQAAVSQFKALNAQLRAFLQAVAKQLQKQRALLAQQRAHRRQLRRSLAETQRLLKTYLGLIANLLAVRKAYNAAWVAQSAQRASEVATIKRVISIFQVNYPHLNSGEALSRKLASRKL